MDAPFQLDRAKSPVPTKGRVTAGQLFAEHATDTSTRVIANGRRELAVCGATVATVGPDPALITPLCATSATGMPVVEVLAAVASQDPTGVLVLETADASKGFAFEVVQGRVTGARGAGPLDRLEGWVAEVHRRYPDRFDHATPSRESPTWSSIAREFVYERVLDHLELAREPGARMTFIRGDIEWAGAKLAPDEGPTLDHLLLEHARRWDELPAIIRRVGDQTRLVVPLSEPPEQPTSKPTTSGSEWDFFDDPDPAALAEWRDALSVWMLCDGQTTIEEIVGNVLIGGFRGLAALSILNRGDFVVFVDEPQPLADGAPPPDSGRPIAPVIPLRALPEPSKPKSPMRTQYALNRPRKAERIATQRPSRRTSRTQPRREGSTPLTPSPIANSRASASATGGHVPVSRPSASSSFPIPSASVSRGRLPNRPVARKVQVYRRTELIDQIAPVSGSFAVVDAGETVRAPAHPQAAAPAAAKRRNWLNIVVVILGLIAFGTGAGVAIKLHLRNADAAASRG